MSHTSLDLLLLMMMLESPNAELDYAQVFSKKEHNHAEKDTAIYDVKTNATGQDTVITGYEAPADASSTVLSRASSRTSHPLF